jgi:hypothetical protein
MTATLVVVGTGGFGREVLDVVDAANTVAVEPVWNVVGVVDDAPSEDGPARLTRRGVDYLGGVEDYLQVGRTVGGCAYVLRDVPPGALVKGVPTP